MSFGQRYIKHYPHITWQTKLFLAIRYLTAAFEGVEQVVPTKGRILDVGCGHGLFSVILATHQPARKVYGVEPDSNKVAIAKQLEKTLKNFTVTTGVFSSTLFPHTFDAAVIIDVLYLLPIAEKKALLQEVSQTLKPGGSVIIKTNDKQNSMGFVLCYLQELVSVFVAKHTHSQNTSLYFLSLDEYRALFSDCGLKIVEEKRVTTAFYHPHYIFVLHKSG